jgi:hypothetical protein
MYIEKGMYVNALIDIQCPHHIVSKREMKEWKGATYIIQNLFITQPPLTAL